MDKRENTDTNDDKELEEEIETTEQNIDDNKFVEFLQPSEVSAPVLEKIADAPEITTLEQNIINQPINSEPERNQTGYITRNEPEENITTEQKYQVNINPPVLRPVEISEELPRQEFLNPMLGRITDNENLLPEIIETRIIDEKNEKKYKEFKL